MKDFDPASFGRFFAETYDDGAPDDTEATIAVLAGLAGDGPVLELAIGTGRIGLPLAERGLRVDGVELAPEMAAKLREKPGGDQLNVVVGNMADVPVEGHYRLIYVVYNSFTNLSEQEDQIRTVANAAAHLTDDGLFVVDGFLPRNLTRWPERQRVAVEVIEPEYVQFEVEMHDPSRQRVEKTHLAVTPDGPRFYPTVHRYVWPSELDLMARLAALELRDRWASWYREPFNAESDTYVCVYGKSRV